MRLSLDKKMSCDDDVEDPCVNAVSAFICVFHAFFCFIARLILKWLLVVQDEVITQGLEQMIGQIICWRHQ